MNNEKNLQSPSTFINDREINNNNNNNKDKEIRLSRILSPTRFRPAPHIDHLINPILLEKCPQSPKPLLTNSSCNIVSPTGSSLSTDTSTTASCSSQSSTSSISSSSYISKSPRFNQKTSSPKYIIPSKREIKDDSRYYEQFDVIPTIYDNHNIQLSSSSSESASSSSSSISPPPLPQTLPPLPPPSLQSHRNLDSLSDESKRNSNSSNINNRLFFNFNHKTSSLNQNYLNSLESSPSLSYQNINSQHQTHNKRNILTQNNNNSNNNNDSNNKPAVLRILKDTANLLTESVNVCGSKHIESSSRLINDSKEVICSPITALKHKDSFMRRIFNRSKSKDKPDPCSRLSKHISNNSNCTYATMNESNDDGSHYNLTSVGRKASNNSKKSGKKC